MDDLAHLRSGVEYGPKSTQSDADTSRTGNRMQKSEKANRRRTVCPRHLLAWLACCACERACKPCLRTGRKQTRRSDSADSNRNHGKTTDRFHRWCPFPFINPSTSKWLCKRILLILPGLRTGRCFLGSPDPRVLRQKTSDSTYYIPARSTG